MADDYTLKDRITDLGNSIADQFKTLARQLEIIDEKLDGKASLAELSKLEDRLTKILDRHDKEIGELQKDSSGSLAVSKYKQFWIGLMCSGLIGTLLYIAAWGKL